VGANLKKKKKKQDQNKKISVFAPPTKVFHKGVRMSVKTSFFQLQ
jgi:hypothetical protein